MNDNNFKDRVYLKAKESFIVGLLLIVAIIIFIVPIILIFLLRFIFKLFLKNKEIKLVDEESIYAYKLSSKSK